MYEFSVRLYDAASDTQYWSNSFDDALDDIFALQDEVASAVVEQLEGSLDSVPLNRGQTTPEAYMLFLQAHKISGMLSDESQRKALDLYEQVISIDPTYERAWTETAATLFRLSALGVMNSKEARQRALQALQKALEINPNSADALRGMAWEAFKHDDDLPKAASALREKPWRCPPSDAALIGDFSVYLNSIGRVEESIQFGEYQVLSRTQPVQQHLTILVCAIGWRENRAKAVLAFETGACAQSNNGRRLL